MIAVTGATGRIGNVLVKRLVKNGEDVKCIVRKTSDPCAIESVKLQKAIADWTFRQICNYCYLSVFFFESSSLLDSILTILAFSI